MSVFISTVVRSGFIDPMRRLSVAYNSPYSIIGVGVFAGLTAHDTQRIKAMYDWNDDATSAGRKAVMGALSLYLNFINLFMMLLRLAGNRR